jgi:hypothetical protein
MSTPPPEANNTPVPGPQPAPEPRKTSARKLFLIVSGALLLGWFAWLGYTALTKSREPIVSHAQATAATAPVVAALTAGEEGKESQLVRPGGIEGHSTAVLRAQADKPAFLVTVKESLTNNGPAAGTVIGVSNITGCSGYGGPGDYLLLLAPVPGGNLDNHPAYVVVGPQRSPGADLEGAGTPTIYKWGPGVQAQARRLFP